MSLISGVFNNYVAPAALSRPMVIGAGCIVAIPALELVKRISEDYVDIQKYNIPTANESESDKSARLEKKELRKNTMIMRGVTALILGGCASNFIPGSGAVGLLGYLTYSRFNWGNELRRGTNPCISLILPGLVLNILSDFKKLIAGTIIHGVTIAAKAVGSFFYQLGVKVARIGLAIFHGIRSIAKVIVIPFKMLGSLLKIFKPFIRHPLLGLGMIAGVICLIGCVKYGHRLTGAAAVVARALNFVVVGLWKAGAFILRGLGKAIRPLGIALSFIPSVLMRIVQVVRAVFYFIFHPLKALGLTKTAPAKPV